MYSGRPKAAEGPVRSISPHSHAFPALDGLRGLAVSLVLLVHVAVALQLAVRSEPTGSVLAVVSPLVSMGGSGVHLFFVLSGFLLFLPFARTLLRGADQPHLWTFYVRRLKRIIPAYYVALVFSYVIYERERVDSPALQFVTHALLIHNFSDKTQFGLDEPTWTMATEAQFYILLPLIGAGAVWLMSRSKTALAIGAVALLGASAATGLLTAILTDIWPAFASYQTSLSALRYLTTFGWGISVACLYVLAEGGAVPPRTRRHLSRLGGALFVTIFALLMVRHSVGVTMPAFDFYGYSTIMGLCYAGLLTHVLMSPDSMTSRALSRPAPRFVGDISYSVYLLHQPILLAWLIPVAARYDGPWPLLITIGGLFLVVGPLAVGLFVFVERPFLTHPARRGDDRARRAASGRIHVSERPRAEAELDS